MIYPWEVVFNGKPISRWEMSIGCRTPLSHALRKMQVGDTIFVEGADTRTSVYRSIKQFAKRNNMKICAATDEDGLNAWRVE